MIVRAKFSDPRTLVMFGVLTTPSYYHSNFNDVNVLNEKIYRYISSMNDPKWFERRERFHYSLMNHQYPKIVHERINDCADGIDEDILDFHIDQIRFLFEICYCKVGYSYHSNCIFAQNFIDKVKVCEFFKKDFSESSYKSRHFIDCDGIFFFREGEVTE